MDWRKQSLTSEIFTIIYVHLNDTFNVLQRFKRTSMIIFTDINNNTTCGIFVD